MYLSKVSILQSRQASQELIKLGKNGSYASHQLLWKLFTEEDKRNFLFREEISENGSPEFFILSKNKPSVSVGNLSEIFNIRTKEFNPQLIKGQRLAYKLRVNPTVCKKNEDGKNKRHDVLMNAKFHARQLPGSNKQKIKVAMDNAAHQWISASRRLEQWGIQLDSLPEIECYTQHHSHKKTGNSVRFSSVDFQGVMTIKDPSLFIDQYQKGFGRAKSMGCGLMMIRPI